MDMSLRVQAYKQVREQILREGFERGSYTSEREIAAALGDMSRTPVREALAVLTATGLLDQVPQRGVAVRSIDTEEALRAVRLRLGMEPVMVEELISIEQPDLSAFEDAMEAMRAAYADGDEVEFMLADTEMHRQLADSGGFSTSVTGLQGLRDQVHLFRLEHPLTSDEMDTILSEHELLFSAVEEHDSERATAAITGHLLNAVERIEAAGEADTYAVATARTSSRARRSRSRRAVTVASVEEADTEVGGVDATAAGGAATAGA
jgi:DNA-binding GntR family transcriptional regulator